MFSLKSLCISLILVSSSTYGAGLVKSLNNPAISNKIKIDQISEQLVKTVSPEILILENQISEQLKNIRKSRMVYSWDVASPRDRTANYCIDQCACLNRELIKFLKAHYQVRTLTIRPTGASEVSIRNSEGRFLSYTFYHMVTAVKLQNKWFVIDPLITSGARPEPLSVWLQRLEHPERLTGSVQ